MYRIFQELLQLIRRYMAQLKNVQRIQIDTFPVKIDTADMYVERCTVSLASRETQMKKLRGTSLYSTRLLESERERASEGVKYSVLPYALVEM